MGPFPASDPSDPSLTVQLPLSVWQGVLGHLELGVVRTVLPWMHAIIEQLEPQIAAAAAAQQVAVVAEARNVVAEAADAELRAHPASEPGQSPNTKAVH